MASDAMSRVTDMNPPIFHARRAWKCLLAAALATLPIAATAGWEEYSFVDIGALTNSTRSEAASVNEDGIVVGSHSTANGELNGFTYNSRTAYYTDIGRPPETYWFVARDINREGVVVGSGYTTPGADHVRTSGFVYTGDFSKPRSTSSGDSEFLALNDSGVIVGTATDAAGEDQGIRITLNGDILAYAPPEKGTVATQTALYSINKAGIAVGGSTRVDFAYPGFVTSRRAVRTDGRSLQLLGTLPGKSESVATSINDLGRIVGYAYNTASNGVAESSHEAFLLDGSLMMPLGILPGTTSSRALHINNRNVIVGYCTGDSGDVAFLHDPVNGIRNLNDAVPAVARDDWELTRATSINDSGQIAGIGRHNGQFHAFLLNPISNVNEWFLLQD